MKKFCCYPRGTAAILCFATLAACGNTPVEVENDEAQTVGNHYIGSRAVYAHLEQSSGGSWILKTVTDSDNPTDKGFLLRLNDLAPSFDIRVAECEPQAYPANHKCNPTQPFRDKQLGVMGRIISGGIAAGTAGKVTDLSRTYKTVFDQAAFNQAVDEALINTGLNRNRREFLHALERYDVLLEGARSELAVRQQKALSQYRGTGNLNLDIRPTITGLNEYYSNDINFRDLVQVKPRSATSRKLAQVQRQEILPCNARQCARKAKEAMNELNSAIESGKNALNASLAEQTSEYTLNCSATSHAGYFFTMKCPDRVSVTDMESDVIPVSLNILSRDFDAVYPVMNIGDEKLSIVIDGIKVRFRNRTSNYLSVSAQTVYYNSQVHTRSEPIDIAPGVVVEREIDDFVTPAIKVESSYHQMTPDKANRTTLQFGFATKYRLAGSSAEVTLYDFRDFVVGCIIENRIRPGSCDYPPAEDLAEEAEPSGQRSLPASDPDPDGYL